MSSTSTTWTVDTETTGSVLTTRLSGDITLSSGDKLYLDGGTHTYFTESSNDIVRLYAGVDSDGRVRYINMSPKSAAGTYNTVYGEDAGAALDGDSDFNSFFGWRCGDNTMTGGDNNTGMGYVSLSKNTTGDSNTAIGRETLYENTTGANNTAVGAYALDADVSGNRSTAIGSSALTNQSFSGSTEALNTAIGYQAGFAILTGLKNTLLGAKAGEAVTTGSENICIGYNAEISAVGTDNEIVIGTDATGLGANKIVLGDATHTDVYMAEDQGAAVWLEHINMLERSSDPTEPTEGHAVIWMSDGSGKGDDGDIMIASQAGGATKYATLFDHSGGSSW